MFLFYYKGISLVMILKTTTVWSTFFNELFKSRKKCFFWGYFSKAARTDKNDNQWYNADKYLNKVYIIKVNYTELWTVTNNQNMWWVSVYLISTFTKVISQYWHKIKIAFMHLRTKYLLKISKTFLDKWVKSLIIYC